MLSSNPPIDYNNEVQRDRGGNIYITQEPKILKFIRNFSKNKKTIRVLKKILDFLKIIKQKIK